MNAERPPTGATSRAARVAAVAAKHASREAVRRIREPFVTEDQRAADRDAQVLRLADDLVGTLGTMKGAAMKLGQVISLLNLGLSTAAAREEFTLRLAPLFSHAPAAPDRVMLDLLETELGLRRSKIANVELPSIAAASLGQVYRGTLADGRTVAIKVQYPSARHTVRADLKNLALLTKIYRHRFSGSDLGLQEVVAEVSDQITMELDYQRELGNHLHAWQTHRDHPVFVIPEPIADLCSDRVLVTEYLDGATVAQALDREQSDRDRLGEAIYRFYCGDMYTTGTFCADPHPGNIVVLPNEQVGFLDFGLYVRMTSAEIGVERAVLAAVMTGDAEAAYRAAQAEGFIVDTDAMSPQMTVDYISAVASWYLTPGAVQITDRVTHRCLSQAMFPHSEFGRGIFRQRMQPAHAFSRRTEMSVCALLGSLQARANWHDIAAEWILDAPASTPMGKRIANWRRD